MYLCHINFHKKHYTLIFNSGYKEVEENQSPLRDLCAEKNAASIQAKGRAWHIVYHYAHSLGSGSGGK